MGEVKETMDKWKRKKWGKEEWIILILIGIFLCVIFWPSEKKSEKENTAINTKNMAGENEKQSEAEDYREQMEKRLEEVLKSIDGIDNVRAMITLKNSEEEVVLKEENKTCETTKEEDSQGGVRTIESESKEETVCYEKEDGDGTNPYVVYTVAPTVEGVLVVVGGEKASLLRTQIVKAVQALFGVESHKVVVIKMKET